MQTLGKWLAIAVGVLVVLSLALSLIVLLLVDPNDYREQIETAVEAQTGRPLTIEGELDLDVLPCCGVSLGPLALGNPPGWQQQKFAEVNQAAVRVQVLPLLLDQELKVGEITLDGLELRLIRRSDGSTNWEFASSDQADDVDISDDEAVEPTLDVAGIRVTNGKLVYLDKAAGDEIRLANISLNTGRIRSGTPFDFSAGVDADGLLPDTRARIRLEGTAELPAGQTAAELASAELGIAASGPGLPESGADVTVALGRVSGLGGDTVTVESLQLDAVLDALRVRLTGSGELAGEQPRFNGRLSIPEFAPRDFLNSLGGEPVATTDPDALQSFALEGDWSVSGDAAKLDNLSGRLDDTALEGILEVLSIERQALAFELELDRIDADRYLAPSTDEDAAEPAEPAESDGDEKLDLPLNDLRALDLQGRIGIGALTFSGARLTDVDIVVSADDGLIKLRPLTAKLYDGTYAGNVRLNVRGNVPRLSVNEKLRNVQVQALLGDVGSVAPLSGVASMTIKGNSAGNTVNALIRRLRGDVSFSLEDAAYSGADLWYEIRKARALLQREAAPAPPASPVTRLQELAGSLQFADGKLQNRDLAAALDFMKLTGSGSVNLLDGAIDYSLQAQVTETPVFDDGTQLDKLTGLTLPVTVSGSLTDPSIGVDAKGVATELARDKVREKLIDKLGLEDDELEADGEPAADDAERDPEDEVKDRVKDKLRDLLGG